MTVVMLVFVVVSASVIVVMDFVEKIEVWCDPSIENENGDNAAQHNVKNIDIFAVRRSKRQGQKLSEDRGH